MGYVPKAKLPSAPRADAGKKVRIGVPGMAIGRSIYPGLISEILGEIRLGDGRTVFEHGRDSAVGVSLDYTI